MTTTTKTNNGFSIEWKPVVFGEPYKRSDDALRAKAARSLELNGPHRMVLDFITRLGGTVY